MTKTTLERGQEIQNEIRDLEYAMHEVTRHKLFDAGSCSRSTAHVFLSSLENNVKAYTGNEINARIKALTEEFYSL